MQNTASSVGASNSPRPAGSPPAAGGSSFLDEWLAKRQQITAKPAAAQPAPNPAFGPTAGTAPVPTPTPAPAQPPAPAPQRPAQPATPAPAPNPFIAKPVESPKEPVKDPTPPVEVNKLHVREPGQNTDDEVHIKLR
jgi:hypothetical protein